MKVNVIVAGCEYETNKVGIGYKQKIPWYVKEDVNYFKNITDGNFVIMGRKTWESIPEKFRPFSNRMNIIVSSTYPEESQNDKRVKICSNLDVALSYLKENMEMLSTNSTIFKEPMMNTHRQIFIIGGESLYNEIIDSFPTFIDKLYFTNINKKHLKTQNFDTYFPLEKYKNLLGNNIVFKDC